MLVRRIGGITFITLGRWQISISRKLQTAEKESKLESLRVSRKMERRLRRIGA